VDFFVNHLLEAYLVAGRSPKWFQRNRLRIPRIIRLVAAVAIISSLEDVGELPPGIFGRTALRPASVIIESVVRYLPENGR
jgi:hypothetical protein